MKTKFLMFTNVLAAVALYFDLSRTALAQMSGYGNQKTDSSSNKTSQSAPGTNSNAPKPGTVLTGGAVVATPITQEEAMKKYPPPNGKSYPMGNRDNHKPSGWINSPYSSVIYDCSNIPQGGLALDTRVNKVFVRPQTK